MRRAKQSQIFRPRHVKVVDFFCGAGGLTHGLIQTKLNVVAGVDSDPHCKFPYEHNNEGAKFICRRIESVNKSMIASLIQGGRFTVFVGCAPCQPFSSYTTKVRNTRKQIKNSGNWELIMDFLTQVKRHRPDVVSMENVPQICKEGIFSEFTGKLKKCGYKISHRIVNCSKHGIPQSRRRLVLLASLHGEIQFPPESGEIVPLREAFKGVPLPAIEGGEQSPTDDPLHVASKLGPLNMKRIKASRPGGTWEDWKKSLLPDCYKKASGQTYKNVYGRMSWDKPAPTITGQFYRYGTGRFGHPDQNRAISLREGALIQTFPHDYQFVEPDAPLKKTVTGIHIGNAVPVALGCIIGKTIINHLKGVRHV